MLRALALSAWLACACQTTSHPPALEGAGAVAGFEKMKSLHGDWKGTAKAGDEESETTVQYRITSAGTAVEERLFVGTPHEMVTMYYLDKGELRLTHYCAAGNQPTMVAIAGAPPNELEFDFVAGSNMKSIDDQHMHSGRFLFVSPDKLVSAWTGWVAGKPDHTVQLALERQK